MGKRAEPRTKWFRKWHECGRHGLFGCGATYAEPQTQNKLFLPREGTAGAFYHWAARPIVRLRRLMRWAGPHRCSIAVVRAAAPHDCAFAKEDTAGTRCDSVSAKTSSVRAETESAFVKLPSTFAEMPSDFARTEPASAKLGASSAHLLDTRAPMQSKCLESRQNSGWNSRGRHWVG